MNREIQQFKADFFKALSHPLRINIMEILCEGDKNVNELQSLCGVEGAVISSRPYDSRINGYSTSNFS